MKSKLRVVIRCDGSQLIGLGHVVRCLALADVLRDTYKSRVDFAVREGPLGRGLIKKQGYRVIDDPDNSKQKDQWLTRAVNHAGANVLVLDVRDNLAIETVRTIRDSGVLVVVIDDPSERRMVADLAFYPPVPQVGEMNWNQFRGELYSGWEWVLLRKEFARAEDYRLEDEKSHPLLLITMGGSDPYLLTCRAVTAIDALKGDFDVSLLLGPGFKGLEELEALLAEANRKYIIIDNEKEPWRLFGRADLAVASFGVTAYELAAAGVPSILLGISEDHVRSASSFDKAGIAFNLGLYSAVSDKSIRQAVGSLLADQPLRRQMAARARQLLDGRGAGRIAELIYRKVSQAAQ
jgi:spore coat polysaccharide biosynthesis predicted glycosyltransferase SpsG